MQIEYTMKVVAKYCSIHKANRRSYTVVDTTNFHTEEQMAFLVFCCSSFES